MCLLKKHISNTDGLKQVRMVLPIKFYNTLQFSGRRITEQVV